MRPNADFMAAARALETAYLESDDPIRQSGFHGGRDRWVAERSPLVDGIAGDGDFLDVGCANGLLVSDLVTWAAAKGHRIAPYGVDLGVQLIDLARQRMVEHQENFVVADAWTWQPDRQWAYVYSLLDLSPPDLRCEWLRRLYGWVEPGGTLIVGAYGSCSQGRLPEDVHETLRTCGFEVTGSSAGGDGTTTRFAWVSRGADRPR